MPDYKIIIGIISVIIGIIAYVPYYINIFRSKTKPHAFSWLVWGIITTIAFLGQLYGNGGAGIWATALASINCFAIFVIAIFRGEKEITLSDKISMATALIAILIWIIANNPLFSIILVIIIDTVGFYPTYRKSYKKPYEETIILYLLAGIKFIISIFALSNFTVITYLYPAMMVITHIGFALMVLVRRKQIGKEKKY